MQSKAATVREYLDSLPPDRRQAIDAVRRTILKNLDTGFEEGMSYGMIGYYVPHRLYPAGYHCNPKLPLPFAGLASQKQYMSLYVMFCYDGCDMAEWFRTAWEKTGRKLDMGKCCIRFKRLEDVALEVVGEAFRRVTVKKWIGIYESSLGGRTNRKAGAASAKKRANPRSGVVVKKKKKTAGRTGTRAANKR